MLHDEVIIAATELGRVMIAVAVVAAAVGRRGASDRANARSRRVAQTPPWTLQATLMWLLPSTAVGQLPMLAEVR